MNKYNDKNDWCYTVDDYEEDDDWLDLINNHVHLSKCSFVESLMIISMKCKETIVKSLFRFITQLLSLS